MSWEQTAQLKRHARQEAVDAAFRLEAVRNAAALDIGDYDTTTLLARIARSEITVEHVTAVAIRK